MAKTRPHTGGTPEPAPAARRRGDPPRALGHPRARRRARPRAGACLDHRGRGAGLARPAPRHRLRAAAGRRQHPEVVRALDRNRAELRRLVTDRIDLRFSPELDFRGRHPLRPDGPHPRAAALARRSAATSRTEPHGAPRARPAGARLARSLDKPAGLTSADAVDQGEAGRSTPRKAGHAGTLDPAATGLLALAFGEATKTVPFVADAGKAYRFTVRWGAATATDDAEGAVLATSGAAPDAGGDPRRAARLHRRHPAGPAAGLGGQGRRRRAYDLARAGETLDLAARPLHVERLELVAVPDADTAVLEMVCGKGGYVRSIARDLGARLGCLGHVVELRRLWSGPFTPRGRRRLGRRSRRAPAPALAARLLPVEAALGRPPRARLPRPDGRAAANGNPVPLAGARPRRGRHRLGERRRRPRSPSAPGASGALHPSRVFVPRPDRARRAPRLRSSRAPWRSLFVARRSAPGPSSPSPTRWPRARPTTSTPALLLALRNPADPADPLGPGWVEEIGRDVTALGGLGILTAVTLAVAGYLWLQGNRRSMWLMLFAVGGGQALSTLAKRGLRPPAPRPRAARTRWSTPRASPPATR